MCVLSHRVFPVAAKSTCNNEILTCPSGGGDILLSDEAFRRVSSWLAERGLTAEPETLELKGFDGAQPAYRLASPVRV